MAGITASQKKFFVDIIAQTRYLAPVLYACPFPYQFNRFLMKGDKIGKFFSILKSNYVHADKGGQREAGNKARQVESLSCL